MVMRTIEGEKWGDNREEREERGAAKHNRGKQGRDKRTGLQKVGGHAQKKDDKTEVGWWVSGGVMWMRGVNHSE